MGIIIRIIVILSLSIGAAFAYHRGSVPQLLSIDVLINGVVQNALYIPTNSPVGTVVGTIHVNEYGGIFNGTFLLVGTDAASFKVVGSTLKTASILPPGRTYSFSIIASSSGIVGTPLIKAETV